MSDVDAKVIDLIAGITGADEVRHDPDLALYDQQLMDSLQTVELIVAISETFGLEISPADIDRAEWATPRLIAAFVSRRVGA